MPTTTTAKSLLDQGLKPVRPADVLRNEVLARLDRLTREERLTLDEAAQELFPHAILEERTLRVAVSALVAGSNLLLLGPTGSGKTNLAKDVWELYPKEILAVEGCPVQDDPMSLVDAAFSRDVPPCPHCKATYGGAALAERGDFDARAVDPSAVPVRRVRLREGHGFARIQGSPEVFPDYLTGALNLAKLEEIGDPSSPLVLEPGKVMQAHRGVLLVDEIGKLPRGTQNVLLQALQEGIVSPAKSRETFPASFVAVTTSNLEDLDSITEPLIGRLSGVHVGFNESRDKNLRIIRDNVRPHGTYVPGLASEATVTLMTRWRRTMEGVPELSEVGSNRTMIDVLRRAESHARLVGRPAVALEDLRVGARDAMLGRIRARSAEGYDQNRAAVETYLQKHWADLAKDASDRVWCRFFVAELKEDKAEAQRLLDEARAVLGEGTPAALPPKVQRFASWLAKEEGPNLSFPADEAALHVLRTMHASGAFDGGRLPEAPKP